MSRNEKSLTQLLVGLLAMGLLLAACAPGSEAASMPSERPAGETFELTGTLQSQADDAWVVDGQTVRVAGSTELSGSPSLGDLVKVEGSGNSAGELVAREIQTLGAAGDASGAEVEFFGVVTSIGAEEWVIGPNTVRVSPQTEVKAGVALGASVKVHALPQSDGSLLAREIEPAAGGDDGDDDNDNSTPRPDNEQEFTGTLTVVVGDIWTVGGRQVRITTATEVKDSPQVGDVLKVHASPGADGVLVAREVELAAGADDDDDQDDDDDANPGEEEFTGVLSAINGDLWTIGGRQVRVTSGTEVKDAPQVGDVVKVHASLGSDGVLVAREVELAAGDDDDADDDDNGDDDNSGPGSDDDDNGGDDNSGPGSGDDGDDDNSGGNGGDSDDDNSGPGSGGDDDNSGGSDDDDDDNSGSGGDDDDDDDNSGSGGGDDDDDDDNSGSDDD